MSQPARPSAPLAARLPARHSGRERGRGAIAGAILGGVLGATVNGRQYYRDTRGYCYYVDQYGQPHYELQHSLLDAVPDPILSARVDGGSVA